MKEIENLKTGKFCDPDNLTAEFLKGRRKEVIALPLTLLFDIGTKTYLLHFKWKRDLVCSIHKSGPNSVVSNFRHKPPLSLSLLNY